MTQLINEYGYGLEVQTLFLELLLADSPTYVICQSIFDHTLFDKKLQKTAAFIQDFANEHSVIPPIEIVNASTGSELNRLTDIKPEYLDWLITQFEQFIRHKSLERAIIESADLLDSGQYGLVEDKIKTAVQIGLNRDLGIEYYRNPRDRLNRIRDSNGQISTGWKSLDRLLYGGMNRGELSIFCAQSGGGKSLFLANLAINWSQQGLHVVYVSCELSEDLVAMRMDSMITGVESKNIFKRMDDVEIKVTAAGKKNGIIQIKYLPSGKNCNDLRSYLKEFEIRSGKKVDVLLVDYLDLLHPVRAKISAENLFIKDKYVSEELRALAAEKRCVLVTASQLNRNSIDEVEFNHSHISGGLSKIQTADNVFAINKTKMLQDNGKYELQLLKTRNSNGVGKSLKLDFDRSTMRIRDEDDWEDHDDSAEISTSQRLLDTLSPNNEVVPSNDDHDEPRVASKGEIKASKLKQFIKSHTVTQVPMDQVAATIANNGVPLIQATAHINSNKYDIIESDDDHF